MRALAAGLAWVNASTVSALLLGMLAHGLSRPIAIVSVSLGALVAVMAWLWTRDVSEVHSAPVTAEAPRKARKGRRSKEREVEVAPVRYDYRKLPFWLLACCFAALALRSFCWLLYIDGGEWKVQSPNNLGDLALHLTYIRNFAHGVALWPENPIYVFSHLRYPAGTDLFNSVLLLLGVDLLRGLVWTGLAASIATFYAFYRWGGNFAIAGFLFNGGLIGFKLFQKWELLDYQGDKTVAWKSIPLTMFVPQRGMLYALPVGLLLLCHWRTKFSPAPGASEEVRAGRGFAIPLWLEVLLYSTLPLFHAHTFLALSIVLGFFFLFGRAETRRQTLFLFALSFLPAVFLSWLITDHFQAGSVLTWQPGWVQHAGDFAMPFLRFWLLNFGLWVPVVFATLYFCGRTTWQTWVRSTLSLPANAIFLLAATALFLLTYLVKTAPWEWDNIKILVWAYFLLLPLIVTEFLPLLPKPARVGLYVLLFTSGAVTLLGGLAAGRTGFGIADRNELDSVGGAVRSIPPEARFAAYPTYNHPLLLLGRKCVLGYPGHLWTQGFTYTPVEAQLKALMQGQLGWREKARDLHARYLYWGAMERTNYPTSSHPWERESALVASGAWGAIYDLEKPHIFLP